MENLFTLKTALKTAVKSDRHTEFHYFRILQEHWHVVVGDSLAEKTSPSRLVRKILYILVQDSAYAHQLSYFTDRLIELIASPAILGEGKVLKIKFRVGEEVKAPEIRIDRKQRLKPLKNDELKMVTQVSDQIKDKDLRAVFSSYMTTIKRRENEQGKL